MIRFCNKCQADTERKANGNCKPCAKVRDATYYAANHKKIRAATAAWQAANPERRKANDAAWVAANLDRHKENVAAWVKANPGARQIISQNYEAKKRENGGTLSKGLAAKLFKLQRGKCACCSLPLGDNYHLDHIEAVSTGGQNIDANMQLLRKTCNLQKSAKHPVDFMQSRGYLL